MARPVPFRTPSARCKLFTQRVGGAGAACGGPRLRRDLWCRTMSSKHVFPPLVALDAMATVTEHLRVGTLVLNNDLRHPCARRTAMPPCSTCCPMGAWNSGSVPDTQNPSTRRSASRSITRRPGSLARRVRADHVLFFDGASQCHSMGRTGRLINLRLTDGGCCCSSEERRSCSALGGQFADIVGVPRGLAGPSGRATTRNGQSVTDRD